VAKCNQLTSLPFKGLIDYPAFTEARVTAKRLLRLYEQHRVICGWCVVRVMLTRDIAISNCGHDVFASTVLRTTAWVFNLMPLLNATALIAL